MTMEEAYQQWVKSHRRLYARDTELQREGFEGGFAAGYAQALKDAVAVIDARPYIVKGYEMVDKLSLLDAVRALESGER